VEAVVLLELLAQAVVLVEVEAHMMLAHLITLAVLVLLHKVMLEVREVAVTQ
jgi:hypothetical protein